MHTRFVSAICAGIVLALLVTPSYAQDKNGRQMKITVTASVQMQGMDIPAHTVTRKVCAPPGERDPREMFKQQKGSDCKISDYKQSGDTTSYHIACTKPQPINGDATFHKLDDGGYKGTMHMTASAGGKAMQMSTQYESHPVGTCVYTPPAQ